MNRKVLVRNSKDTYAENEKMECCWCLCLSLSFRGASYFASSVHNFCGLYMLRIFLINIVRIQHYEKNWENVDGLEMILTLMYIMSFLLTGVLIFRGIEKELRHLIQCGAGAFLVVQGVALIVILLLWMDSIDLLVLKISENVVYTTLYMGVLYLYCRRLWKDENMWKM